MELKIRDGNIDIAILSGPRLAQWPTQGVRVLSRHCSDAGLKVGWYGGVGLRVRGVLPQERSGAVVLVEDAQERLHRIQAKAVAKIIPELNFPIPFPGWYSPGLIPESTAKKLLNEGQVNWSPVVVVLGTGNRAFRFASALLQNKITSRVVCVESVFDRVQGWEVEKRRFEILGGKIIFGKLVQFTQKSHFLWQLKVQDQNGTRVIDTARVVSVGPYESDAGFREYPAGSFFIEWENTEAENVADDVERVLIDEHRAIILAGRLIRGLANPSAEVKSQLEKNIWQSKLKLRELEFREQKRFGWEFEGKWLSGESKKDLAEFSGTLKKPRAGKMLASIECVETIGCRVCEKACPADAIKIDRKANQFLFENSCTGCGFCLQACPSQVPIMIEGENSGSYTTLVFPYREKTPLQKGDRVGLLNRRGEMLANGKVLDQFLDGDVPLFKVEVPSHLIWEARGMVQLTSRPPTEAVEGLYEEIGKRVEVQIQGDARRVQEGQLVSVALFEIGMSRPQDTLICEDGSCGLCEIEVDGIKKYACESFIHQGMTIRFKEKESLSSALCPCAGVTFDAISKTCQASKPDSLEALSQISEATQGKCHGLLCRKSWMQAARSCGVENERFVDWTFPWVDWVFK